MAFSFEKTRAELRTKYPRDHGVAWYIRRLGFVASTEDRKATVFKPGDKHAPNVHRRLLDQWRHMTTAPGSDEQPKYSGDAVDEALNVAARFAVATELKPEVVEENWQQLLSENPDIDLDPQIT